MKKLLFSVLLFSAAPAANSAFAQGCSVCTKTASELDAKSARGLNGGIIYLAAVPLIAMGSIGYVWWRRNRSVG